MPQISIIYIIDFANMGQTFTKKSKGKTGNFICIRETGMASVSYGKDSVIIKVGDSFSGCPPPLSENIGAVKRSDVRSPDDIKDVGI